MPTDPCPSCNNYNTMRNSAEGLAALDAAAERESAPPAPAAPAAPASPPPPQPPPSQTRAAPPSAPREETRAASSPPSPAPAIQKTEQQSNYHPPSAVPEFRHVVAEAPREMPPMLQSFFAGHPMPPPALHSPEQRASIVRENPAERTLEMNRNAPGREERPSISLKQHATNTPFRSTEAKHHSESRTLERVAQSERSSHQAARTPDTSSPTAPLIKSSEAAIPPSATRETPVPANHNSSATHTQQAPLEAKFAMSQSTQSSNTPALTAEGGRNSVSVSVGSNSMMPLGPGTPAMTASLPPAPGTNVLPNSITLPLPNGAAATLSPAAQRATVLQTVTLPVLMPIGPVAAEKGPGLFERMEALLLQMTKAFQMGSSSPSRPLAPAGNKAKEHPTEELSREDIDRYAMAWSALKEKKAEKKRKTPKVTQKNRVEAADNKQEDDTHHSQERQQAESEENS